MKIITKKITMEETEISFPVFLKEKAISSLTECIAIISEKEVITTRRNDNPDCLFYSTLFHNYIPSSFDPTDYDSITENEFWKEYEKVEEGLSENINSLRPLSV